MKSEEVTERPRYKVDCAEGSRMKVADRMTRHTAKETHSGFAMMSGRKGQVIGRWTSPGKTGKGNLQVT